MFVSLGVFRGRIYLRWPSSHTAPRRRRCEEALRPPEMSASIYDAHAQFYVDFVDRGLASENGYTGLLLSTLAECLGDRLTDARVCDLCCGEGYVGRRLLSRGAREVVGIDLSSELIEVARRRAP